MSFSLEAELFIRGIKPALITTVGSVEYQHIDLMHRPGLIKKNGEGHDSECMFFHEVADRNKFRDEYHANNVKGNNVYTTFNKHKLTGIALGYPPKAVEFFAMNRAKKKHEVIRYEGIGIDFFGITFKSGPNEFIDNLRWLFDTYDIPQDFKDSYPIEMKRRIGEENKKQKVKHTYEYLKFLMKFKELTLDDIFRVFKKIK